MSKRVVIYRLGSLGDTIVALPCFHRIMASFPDHERIALTNVPVSSKAPSLQSILGPGGFIHSSIDYPLGLRRAGELLDLAKRLRALKAEALIYVGGGVRGVLPLSRDLLYFRACGFRRIIGAPFRRDLDHNLPDAATGMVESEASRLARCLAPLGPIDLDDPASWDLRLTAAERKAAREVLAPLAGRAFLAVNTGGKDAIKDWGLPNWRALLEALQAHAFPIVFVGSAEDSDRAQTLKSLWRGPTLDLCGRLSPRETSGVLEAAELFLGHDTGPLHLAWTAGTPCVSLFGSSNPTNKWYPLGDQHITLHDSVDVRRITVRAVTDALLSKLGRLADPNLAATPQRA